MDTSIIRIGTTGSTNDLLRAYRGEEGRLMTVAVAECQTAGRGQGTNRWESEDGKNLLFSILTHPTAVPPPQQFVISMAVALAICRTLDACADGFSIKWPNDIYWRHRKVCGILIENRLAGNCIRDCIIGIGLNVNQQVFRSDAPNPVSLFQITGHEHSRDLLLQNILQAFAAMPLSDSEAIRTAYMERLYRRQGLFWFKDAGGKFRAEVVTVEPDGHLVLRDEGGALRSYAFKEVEHICLGQSLPQQPCGPPNDHDKT